MPAQPHASPNERIEAPARLTERTYSITEVGSFWLEGQIVPCTGNFCGLKEERVIVQRYTATTLALSLLPLLTYYGFLLLWPTSRREVKDAANSPKRLPTTVL